MAPLDHCSLSVTFPPSPCPLIVLLTLCASPLPLAHIPRATHFLVAAGEVSGRRRRRMPRDAAESAQGREETALGTPMSESKASASKGTALCPPTGAPPTIPSPSPKTDRSIRTTARTSPSFTPLIPGLIASGIGITLVPQRSWVPHVPLRGPTTTVAPHFGEGIESNVTGRVGSTAYLDCKIEMQQELTVTWLHRKDDSIQLLTVGRHPYSRDSRFLLSYQHSNNWRLQISPVMKNDEGLYECQISTHPVKVRKVFFNVTAPELKIVDEDCNELLERHYKAGSEVKLTCLATKLEEEDGLGDEEGVSVSEGGEQHEEKEVGGSPAFSLNTPLHQGILGRDLWRHGDSIINRSMTESTTRPKCAGPDGRAVSVAVTFHAINAEDEGNYTCSLGVGSSASVHIKILNGESAKGKGNDNTKNAAVPLGIIDLWFLLHLKIISLSILT